MGMCVEESLRTRWNSSNVLTRTELMRDMGVSPKDVDLDNLKKDFDNLPETWKCFMLEWMRGGRGPE